MLDDLFREQGAYTYRDGVNWRAIAAFVLAVLPVVPGFVRAVSTPGGAVADPNFFDRLYSYAWFVTFALSFVAVPGAHARTHAVEPTRRMRPQRHEPREQSEVAVDLQVPRVFTCSDAQDSRNHDMPRVVKCGLIQATHACSTAENARDHPRGEHRQAHGADRAGRTRGRADPLHAGDLHRPVLLRRAERALVRRGRERFPTGRRRSSCRRSRRSTAW